MRLTKADTMIEVFGLYSEQAGSPGRKCAPRYTKSEEQES